MDNIYIVRGTEQAGPFTESEIRAQLASGALTGDALVWWEGLPEWTAVSNTPLGSPAAATVLPTPGVIPAPSASAPVTEFEPAVIAPGAAKTSTLAIVSLTTGVIGFPAILCWPIALILDIAAIITGHLARAQIKKDPS